MIQSDLQIYEKYNYYPKILKLNKCDLMIEMENCGNLLSIRNLPDNWKEQLEVIRKSFLEYQIYVLDLRFMPHTPLIINNVCIKNNKLYLVDLVMHKRRNKNFINNNFDHLIKQIELYYFYRNNIFILYILYIYFK